jgi:hypothetical protein
MLVKAYCGMKVIKSVQFGQQFARHLNPWSATRHAELGLARRVTDVELDALLTRVGAQNLSQLAERAL